MKDKTLSSIKLFIADDHDILTKGIISLFDDEDRIQFVGSTTAVDKVSDEFLNSKANVLLLDLMFGESMKGIDIIEEIKNRDKNAKIIVISQYRNAYLIKRIYAMGVSGFLDKSCVSSDLLSALFKVMDDGVYYQHDIAEMLARMAAENTEITDREFEILRFISQGFSKKQIADEYGLSERTISNSINVLMQKYKVTTINELTKTALLQGLF